jgi:diacylglycerol O-acyltransferase / wax synthase
MPQRHMDRLTSFDASFLANERSPAHMAIGAILICDGEAPSQEDFLDHVCSRLHLLPRFRQRLAFPPLGLGRPFWVDDPDFDPAAHLRRSALPSPGTEEQFRELIGQALSPPLDRSKPLWELWLVEGLQGDRFGVVYKTHHALADGISAVDIGTLLFDVEPNFEPVREQAPWNPRTPPSKTKLVGHAIHGLGSTVLRMARWVAGALRRPRRAARRAADGAAGLWEVTWALTKPAPKVPLNVEIGPDRSFCWTSAGLEEFKRIKNALGGTVNDVSLAVVAGALRRWLADRGASTGGAALQALVPVSVRAENEHGELGNRLTAMRGPLPVGAADPVQRLRIVSKAMDDLKASKQPLGAEAIWGLNDWFRDFAPPVFLAPTAKINFSTRLFNLLVTNFPGPQIPIYVLGRELVGVYPVGFLAKDHALAIAIISYNGQVNFGLLADRASMGDAEQIAAYIDEEVQDLLGAAA